jgi:hypothetical protein
MNHRVRNITAACGVVAAILLLVCGPLMIIGSGVCFYLNVVDGLGPAGGHAGFSNPLPAIPFAAWPFVGLGVSTVGAAVGLHSYRLRAREHDVKVAGVSTIALLCTVIRKPRRAFDDSCFWRASPSLPLAVAFCQTDVLELVLGDASCPELV